jgi:hypothetical protein
MLAQRERTTPIVGEGEVGRLLADLKHTGNSRLSGRSATLWV